MTQSFLKCVFLISEMEHYLERHYCGDSVIPVCGEFLRNHFQQVHKKVMNEYMHSDLVCTYWGYCGTGTTLPTEGTTLPNEETTLPAEETTLPAEETTLPAEETTVLN
jgi:hypothetical protein